MQRFIHFLLVLFAALYGSPEAISTRLENPQPHGKFSPPQEMRLAQAGNPVSPESPGYFSDRPKSEAAAAVVPSPHIALLLPLKSASFGRAAESVRLGFMAAAGLSRGLPVITYSTFDESTDILSAYRQALETGAKIVVGPLTRSGVSGLAASNLVKVPTLALNATESEQPLPPGLYLFGLQAEAEARSIARLAFNEGRRSAIIVSTDAPLEKRMQQAFAEEWERLGGRITGHYGFSSDQSVLIKLRQEIAGGPEHMVFLAAEASKARLVRPYLDPSLAVYATSQVFTGNTDTLANFDLNGIRFVDMPWLLQPDHPAVMIYPRPATALSADLERFYALGIDAFRLAQDLLKSSPPARLSLDGVTGRINLKDHWFLREPSPALFRQGETQSLDGAPQ